MILHRTMFPITAALACMLTLAACGDIKFWESDKQSAVDDNPMNSAQLLEIRKKAATIQTSLDRMTRQDFNFVVGDTMISTALYGEQGDPQLIDERWVDRGGNSGRNRYYFADGSLFHLYGRSTLELNPQGDNAERTEILLRLYFNEKGNMFDYEKLSNESRIDLAENEMSSVMRRAEALRQLAYIDSAGSFDTSAVIAVMHGGDNIPQPMQEATNESQAAAVEEQAPATEPVKSAAKQAGSQTASPVSQAAAPSKQTATSKQPPATQNTTASKQPYVQQKAASVQHQTAAQKAAPVKQPAASPQPAPKSQPAATGKTVAAKQSPTPARAAAPKQQANLLRKPVQPLPDEGADAGIPVHTHRMIPGPLNSSRVRFQDGSTGVTLSASLQKGRHNEYVLRARRGQSMSVTLDTESADVSFRVFLDNSDISGERRSWTGNLPRYGDYHVVVYIHPKSATQSAGCTVTIGIQ